MAPFYILKKIDNLNFQQVEVVRYFQTAKASGLKLFAENFS
jgi:hypothetical protein